MHVCRGTKWRAALCVYTGFEHVVQGYVLSLPIVTHAVRSHGGSGLSTGSNTMLATCLVLVLFHPVQAASLYPCNSMQQGRCLMPCSQCCYMLSLQLPAVVICLLHENVLTRLRMAVLQQLRCNHQHFQMEQACMHRVALFATGHSGWMTQTHDLKQIRLHCL